MASGPIGPYTVQAAISATHAAAPDAAATDWARIVDWYDVLLRAAPSPVVELNRAVAVAMRDGPAVGLELDRRDPFARRIDGLPSGPRGPGRSVPAAGPNGRSPRILSTVALARPAGTRAAVSRTASGRTAVIAAGGSLRDTPATQLWRRDAAAIKKDPRYCRFAGRPHDYLVLAAKTQCGRRRVHETCINANQYKHKKGELP